MSDCPLCPHWERLRTEHSGQQFVQLVVLPLIDNLLQYWLAEQEKNIDSLPKLLIEASQNDKTQYEVVINESSPECTDKKTPISIIPNDLSLGQEDEPRPAENHIPVNGSLPRTCRSELQTDANPIIGVVHEIKTIKPGEVGLLCKNDEGKFFRAVLREGKSVEEQGSGHFAVHDAPTRGDRLTIYSHKEKKNGKYPTFQVLSFSLQHGDRLPQCETEESNKKPRLISPPKRPLLATMWKHADKQDYLEATPIMRAPLFPSVKERAIETKENEQSQDGTRTRGSRQIKKKNGNSVEKVGIQSVEGGFSALNHLRRLPAPTPDGYWDVNAWFTQGK